MLTVKEKVELIEAKNFAQKNPHIMHIAGNVAAEQTRSTLDRLCERLTAAELESLTLTELESLPTIEHGHFGDLKIDDGVSRVWLSRCGVEDGEPYPNRVSVERCEDGVWSTIDEYQAAEDSPMPAQLRDEVRGALQGDSNDAEHDALVSVADHFDIEYQ